MADGRYSVVKNNCGGPGWNILDLTTGKSVAWIYDQAYGFKYPEEDERRANQFADVLNGVDDYAFRVEA